MMLEFLGEGDAGRRIIQACAAASSLAGTTTEIGDAVAERL